MLNRAIDFGKFTPYSLGADIGPLCPLKLAEHLHGVGVPSPSEPARLDFPLRFLLLSDALSLSSLDLLLLGLFLQEVSSKLHLAHSELKYSRKFEFALFCLSAL